MPVTRKIHLYTAPDGTIPFLRFLEITDDKMRQKLFILIACVRRPSQKGAAL